MPHFNNSLVLSVISLNVPHKGLLFFSVSIMVTNYVKKRENPQFNEQDTQKVIECVKKKIPLRKGAEVSWSNTYCSILSYEEIQHM